MKNNGKKRLNMIKNDETCSKKDLSQATEADWTTALWLLLLLDIALEPHTPVTLPPHRRVAIDPLGILDILEHHLAVCAAT